MQFIIGLVAFLIALGLVFAPLMAEELPTGFVRK